VTWVAWRLQRTETLIAAGVLLAVALLLLPSGLEMASAYRHDGLSACLGARTTGSCHEAIDAFTNRFQRLGNLVPWLTLLPGLIGVLFAAPFVGELEGGTYRLAWTQSVTRRRWIAGKLGFAIGSTVVAAVALTLFVTWWRMPFVHLQGRVDQSIFDSEGTVVTAYALFALGLTLAVGALWRRAVPALVVAFFGYFAARLFVDLWLRQRLVAPDSATWKMTDPGPAGLWHAWVLNEFPSDGLGHPARPFLACVSAARGNAKLVDPGCLAAHGGGFTHAVFEPASRFWLLQGSRRASSPASRSR
jgi:hypothetical protein